MTEKYDAIVVGGGPAGASAALTLARAGRDVLLVDKAHFPRDKCCGDGLTTAALRHLERIGFDPSTVPSWQPVRHTTWRSPSGHTIRLTTPDDGLRIAVARRVELDVAVLDLARRSGVEVREGHAVTEARLSGTGSAVTIRAGEAEVEAPYVIGADGMWSPLRRLLTATNAAAPGGERYLGEIHAFRQYLTGVTGPAAERLWVSFEPDLLPGYVWSFPLPDGRVNIGFGIARRPGRTVQWMGEVWPDILQRPHVRAALGDRATAESPHKAWPIPAHIRPEVLSAAGGRALFAGDAARAVDPLTGEGIAQALETGERAAHAVLVSGANDPSGAASRYRRELRFGMQVDHAFSRRLATLVSSEAGARAVIRLAPLGPWRGRYAVRWVFEDNPRAGLLTPWRWRDRFAPKAGAYREWPAAVTGG